MKIVFTGWAVKITTQQLIQHIYNPTLLIHFNQKSKVRYHKKFRDRFTAIFPPPFSRVRLRVPLK